MVSFVVKSVFLKPNSPQINIDEKDLKTFFEAVLIKNLCLSAFICG